ncbi:MAG: NAD(P)-binding domain-containing protein [Pseudolysinimonas sp.]
MTTIGFIGSGNIGSSVARAAIARGDEVVLSNSRGPHTLDELLGDLGEHARAGTTAEAAAADLVVVSIPFRAVHELAVEPFVGKIVMDTNNYYPQRDGVFDEVESGAITVSGVLQRHLVGAQVVKAFNHIRALEIISTASPSGTPGRRGLAIAGDDPHAKIMVTDFIDGIGFDVVDAGTLAESWRIDAGTPGYGPELTAAELEAALAAAVRGEAS